MLSIYPACFFKDETGYSVVFPDLNWLATGGSTETEAMNMAVDCLAGYLYTSWQDGEDVPQPSSIKDISLSKVAGELDFDDFDVGAAERKLVSANRDFDWVPPQSSDLR